MKFILRTWWHAVRSHTVFVGREWTGNVSRGCLTCNLIFGEQHA